MLPAHPHGRREDTRDNDKPLLKVFSEWWVAEGYNRFFVLEYCDWYEGLPALVFTAMPEPFVLPEVEKGISFLHETFEGKDVGNFVAIWDLHQVVLPNLDVILRWTKWMKAHSMNFKWQLVAGAVIVPQGIWGYLGRTGMSIMTSTVPSSAKLSVCFSKDEARMFLDGHATKSGDGVQLAAANLQGEGATWRIVQFGRVLALLSCGCLLAAHHGLRAEVSLPRYATVLAALACWLLLLAVAATRYLAPRKGDGPRAAASSACPWQLCGEAPEPMPAPSQSSRQQSSAKRQGDSEAAAFTGSARGAPRLATSNSPASPGRALLLPEVWQHKLFDSFWDQAVCCGCSQRVKANPEEDRTAISVGR